MTATNVRYTNKTVNAKIKKTSRKFIRLQSFSDTDAARAESEERHRENGQCFPVYFATAKWHELFLYLLSNGRNCQIKTIHSLGCFLLVVVVVCVCDDFLTI